MHKFRLLILILPMLLVVSCGPRLVELPQPPERINQYGYSFMPPDEPGWKIAGRKSQHVILGREGEGSDATLIIMANNSPAPRFSSNVAFEAYVREEVHRSGDAERFKVEKEEVTMIRHAGADCARVHAVSIDHQAVKRSARKGDMMLELLQYVCRHPDHDGTVTTLGYSLRSYPDDRDPQFAEKASRLLDSLQFSDF